MKITVYIVIKKIESDSLIGSLLLISLRKLILYFCYELIRWMGGGGEYYLWAVFLTGLRPNKSSHSPKSPSHRTTEAPQKPDEQTRPADRASGSPWEHNTQSRYTHKQTVSTAAK